ncbi:ribonuclease H-like domain-containing protein [Tanacetum coccineum]
MSEFYEKKGIKKEFSVARTPQQNGVAERRNKTLIEAARTMLADSKLPTTFWVKVVHTACYVQNRVLVVKPHNKTPYELFRGRTPTLSFMRPFGCHVTILNTLDYLGKFDGKPDEGFFVGYSLNSKAFKVYNIRTREVQKKVLVQLVNDEPQPSSDAGKKEDEGVSKESGNDDQESPENNIQDVNTAGPSINTEPDMFSLGDNATLEVTHADFFGDETEVNMSNITTVYLVPSTPNTRIHKGHSLNHVIGDVHSDMDIEECFPLMVGIEERKDRSDLVYQEAKRRYFACTDDVSMEKLTVFSLGFASKARKKMGYFISQNKNVADIFEELVSQSQGTDIDGILHHLDQNNIVSSIASGQIPNSSFDLVAYSDSDYARASLDRKSTTGGCQFLGCILISWQCKKQTVVATSSTKVEYVATASCCRQVLWIQNQKLDYGISKAVWLDLVIPIVEFVRGKSAD